MSRFVLPTTLLLVLLPLLALPRLADACSCVPMSSCQRFASADAVFVADVIDVTEGATGPKRSRMRVVRAYKGTVKAGDEVTVTMPRGSSASCSLDVDAGDRYLIHAGADADRYSTSMCQGSHGLKKDDPLPELPPPGGVVTGTLARHNGDGSNFKLLPIAGVPLWIVTPDGRIESKTDSMGRFSVSGVPPGKWTVRFDVGPAERAEAGILLRAPQDCAEVIAMPRPAGRLIGSVFDHAGKPIAGARVYAKRTDDGSQWFGHDVETGPSGSFSMVGLAAGSYVVGVGLSNAPSTTFPFLPIFHPGVPDQASATPVEIGAETVYLPAIRMREPVPLASIVGEIVCRDGTRPASAFLTAERLPAPELFGNKEYGSESKEGRSVVRVVRGHRYAVRGEIMVKEPMPEGGFGSYALKTPPVEVDPDAPPPRLVLQSELEKCAEPGGVTVPARPR